ncbi:TPA: polysaccharide pyruvyl transferase family protein [Streptococcus suis]
MKILLIGETYSSNLGDSLICQSVEWIISNFSDAIIEHMDLSGRVGFLSDQHFDGKNEEIVKLNVFKNYVKQCSLVNFVLGKKHSQLLLKQNKDFYNEKLKKPYDLVIFAGGQLFLDYFIPSIHYIVNLLDKKQVPIIFNACGVGKLSKRNSIKLKESLLKTSVISVTSRDDVNYLNNLLNENSYVKSIFDPAIVSSRMYQIVKKPSKFIGLGVMWVEHFSVEQMVNFWQRIICELDSRNIAWKLFTNGGEKDYQLCNILLKKLSLYEKKSDYLLERPTNPKEFVEQVSSFNRIISFRLHSLIASYSLGIPSVAVEWDNKVRQFYDKIHLPHAVFSISANAAVVVDTITGIDAEELALNSDKYLTTMLNQVQQTLEAQEIIEVK